jgi:VanZ family protein
MILRFYHKKGIWFSLFAIWTILIIYMSVRPGASDILKKQFFEIRMDYLLHFLAYFAFGFLYVIWRSNRQFEIKSTELAILTASATSFSIGIEYIQLLIPGRAFNVVDMAYNFLGVVCGVGFTYFYLVRRFLRKRDKALSE